MLSRLQPSTSLLMDVVYLAQVNPYYSTVKISFGFQKPYPIEPIERQDTEIRIYQHRARQYCEGLVSQRIDSPLPLSDNSQPSLAPADEFDWLCCSSSSACVRMPLQRRLLRLADFSLLGCLRHQCRLSRRLRGFHASSSKRFHHLTSA